MNAPATSTRLANPFADSPVIAAPQGAAAMAMVSREVENIRVAMLIARQFRRNPREAVDRMLTAFSRLELCEQSQYEYQRGGSKITGLSIRAAEELARQWGNIRSGVEEVARHGDTSEVRVYAQDLETGFMDEKTFHVKHWRDRSEAKGGGYVVKEERDIYELVANVAARRKRACMLTVIPADVQALVEQQIEVTFAKAEVTSDSLATMVNAFNAFGVTKEHLEARLQRHLEAISPIQLASLRRIYNSLKDGMSEPAQWFDISPAAGASNSAASPAAPGASGGAASNASRTATVKDKLHARQGKKSGGGDQGNLPYFTVETAIAELRAAETLEQLDARWKAIVKDFSDTNRSLPLDVEAVKNDRAAHLEQERDR